MNTVKYYKQFKRIFTLSKHAFSGYKVHIVLLIVIGLVTGFLEGVGVSIVIPVMSLITDSGEEPGVLTELIRTLFDSLHVEMKIQYLFALMISLFILKGLAQVLAAYVRARITTDYEYKTRSKIYRNMFKATWVHGMNQRLGQVETLLMIDAHTASMLLRYLSTSILLVTGLTVYLVVAIDISFKMSMITLILGALFFIVFKPFLRKKRIIAHERVKTNANLAHLVSESVVGLKTIKSLQIGKWLSQRGDKYFEQLRILSVRAGLLGSISSTTSQTVGLIFIVILLAFSYKTNDFNIGGFAVIIYMINRIFGEITQLLGHANKIVDSYPHLQSVLKHSREIEEHEEKSTATASFIFQDSICFSGVGFGYTPNKQVLNNVSLRIKKGEMVGVIGMSGSGKTTMVDLLLRLFEPNKGEITLDGVPIHSISLREWREHIGYVSQDIFLANESISHNISMFQGLTEEEIRDAAQKANILDFINSLPDGFNTVVGERGTRLSMGQRQRIAIARVIARNPQFLVLDEATSALDNKSEKYIQDVIRNLKREVTILVVAHRFSTIMDCDRLYVLEDGVFTEEGAPSDLLRNKDSYFSRMRNIAL